MNKNNLNKIFKYLIVFTSGLGILLYLFNNGFSFSSFKYFTHLANLLILILYLLIIFKQDKDSKVFIIFKYQAILAIILTGLIYNLILRPTINNTDYNVNSLADILVHTITPLLVVFDNLIYSKKGIIKPIYPLYWLIFPLFYYLFTYIYRMTGGSFHKGTSYESKYPYFFLNISEHGVGYFIIVILSILLIGYLIYYFNNFLLNKNEGNKNGSF